MTQPSPADDVHLFARWLSGTDITLFELRTAEGHIRLLRRAGGDSGPMASPLPLPPPAPSDEAVMAGSVGVFLDRHPLRDAPLAVPGQAVQPGDVLGLLRIGALLLPVAAFRAGTVAAVVATPGEPVGYGTPLVTLHPAG